MPAITTPNEEGKAEDNYPRITKETLRKICKEKKLYLTPHLNDVLYLHFRGFAKIENLEEYTGLKCLWLESNGIDQIENLTYQTELRCLYLQQNIVKNIENLQDLQLLDTLNVSNNLIQKIENIGMLPKLNTLQIAQNKLTTAEDLKELVHCQHLSVVDLSYNKIDDPGVIDVFAEMSNLHVLNLMGNPVIKKIKNYRKNMIIKIKNLRYLDDRPVFPRERACAEAWAEGGVEAERAERERWINKERQRITDSFNCLAKIRDEAEKRKSEKEKEDEENELEEAVSSDSESEEENATQAGISVECDDTRSTPHSTLEEKSNTPAAIDTQSGNQDLDEMETISVRPRDTSGSIFGGGPRRHAPTHDSLFTDMLTATEQPRETSRERVLITEINDEEIETIKLSTDKKEEKFNHDDDDEENLPPLEDIDVSDPLFVQRFHNVTQKKPLIQEIDEPQEIKRPNKPMIQVLDDDNEFLKAKDCKGVVLEESVDRTAHDLNTAVLHNQGLTQNSNIQEISENIPDEKESSAHACTLEELSKLAETVGSTINRQPINIEKEKRAFQRKMDFLD
ncbi:hypothetical protein QZH41_019296 [Actinostola sp. cb2023]|nr:hypothetical protein QZH41_019296 [Actinostola sp. cb2023]